MKDFCLSGSKEQSVPCVLSSARVYLWLCQRRVHCCAYLAHRAAVQFQVIPVPSLQRAGGPVFPVQAQQHPRGLGANVHRPETSTNHLPSGTAKTWEGVVSVFPPTQTGPCTLELCCLTLFPTPVLSPLGCAFPASAVRETRIL